MHKNSCLSLRWYVFGVNLIYCKTPVFSELIAYKIASVNYIYSKSDVFNYFSRIFTLPFVFCLSYTKKGDNFLRNIFTYPLQKRQFFTLKRQKSPRLRHLSLSEAMLICVIFRISALKKTLRKPTF